MKISEISRQIKKHIEPELSGYMVHRDLIYRVENEFFIKGYYFESRGNDDLDLAVWQFIQPLFVKKDSIVLTLGGRLSYKRKLSLLKSKDFEWWDARKENVDETFKSILYTINTMGEKLIGQTITAESFYKRFQPEKRDNIRIYEVIAYSSVLFANKNFQDKVLNGLRDFCRSQIESDDDLVEIQIMKDSTFLINADTTEKRLLILKTWANETIKHLGLPGIEFFTV